MTDPDAPFIQMSIDVLRNMPLFRGVVAHVFMALGAFVADPVAPTLRDLCDYTQVSKPSVSTALRFLCKHEFARCFADEDGVQRYRPDEHYFRYRAAAPVSVRVLVPIVERQREVKKFLPSPVVVVSSSGSFDLNKDAEEGKQQQTDTGAREIFSQMGIREPALTRLSGSVSAENASAWRDWATQAPRSFRDPVGYVIKQLTAEPVTEPPATRPLFGDDHFVVSDCHRCDFKDYEWHRLLPLNRRAVIATETGRELKGVADDPHYGCEHE